jgi:hypothetical protein
MSFIFFPLRFREGFLRRTSEVEAIVNLLRLMATTPGGSWAGSGNFGVRDIFEQARSQADAHKIARERMNRALIDLGITGYRVDSIEKEKEAVSNRDVDNYVVTIVSTVESSKTHSGALTP